MTPTIFDSEFIIDGIRQEMTPAEVLAVCMDVPAANTAEKPDPIVDERLDPSPGALEYNPAHIRRYLALTARTERVFPVPFAGVYTRCRIAKCLVDTLWREGRFTIDDICLKAEWSLVRTPQLGDLTALYDSVSDAAEYISGMGMTLASYNVTFVKDKRDVSFTAEIAPVQTGAFTETDTLADTPEMGKSLLVPGGLVPDRSSWILYVPFDPSDFRMGGSLLRQALSSAGGGSEPQIGDTAYFTDCFELVRELAEDGILLSASTVSDGGLISAIQGMTEKGECSASIDVSGIVSAYPGSDTVRVLFSEIPGAILQVRDSDFDYIDAEFLLQDVAYFPIGHPSPGNGDVEILSGGSGIQNILDSLLLRDSAEGED